MEDLLDNSTIKGKRLKVNKGIIIALLILIPLGMWVALILAMWKIRTIIISGSVMLVLGTLLFVLGLLRKSHMTTFTAGLILFSILFVFLYIVIYNISPSEAKGSVPFLILLFSVLVSLIATFTIRVESMKS